MDSQFRKVHMKLEEESASSALTAMERLEVFQARALRPSAPMLWTDDDDVRRARSPTRGVEECHRCVSNRRDGAPPTDLPAGEGNKALSPPGARARSGREAEDVNIPSCRSDVMLYNSEI